jgi:hypothetical protein
MQVILGAKIGRFDCRPVQWTWFQAFAIVTATITGIYFAIMRMVLLLVFGVGSMFCLDFSIYPENFRGMDKGKCYFQIAFACLMK